MLMLHSEILTPFAQMRGYLRCDCICGSRSGVEEDGLYALSDEVGCKVGR